MSDKQPAKKPTKEEIEACLPVFLREMRPVVAAHPEDFPDGIDSVMFCLDNEGKQKKLTGESIGIDLPSRRLILPRYSPDCHKVRCPETPRAACCRYSSESAPISLPLPYHCCR